MNKWVTNLWILQLEKKRKEICEFAVLIGRDQIREEIEKETNLQKQAKRTNSHFTERVKRALIEEIDNVVWNEKEKEINRPSPSILGTR